MTERERGAPLRATMSSERTWQLLQGVGGHDVHGGAGARVQAAAMLVGGLLVAGVCEGPEHALRRSPALQGEKGGQLRDRNPHAPRSPTPPCTPMDANQAQGPTLPVMRGRPSAFKSSWG